jgi:hypothetical protein
LSPDRFDEVDLDELHRVGELGSVVGLVGDGLARLRVVYDDTLLYPCRSATASRQRERGRAVAAGTASSASSEAVLIPAAGVVVRDLMLGLRNSGRAG